MSYNATYEITLTVKIATYVLYLPIISEKFQNL